MDKVTCDINDCAEIKSLRAQISAFIGGGSPGLFIDRRDKCFGEAYQLVRSSKLAEGTWTDVDQTLYVERVYGRNSAVSPVLAAFVKQFSYTKNAADLCPPSARLIDWLSVVEMIFDMQLNRPKGAECFYSSSEYGSYSSVSRDESVVAYLGARTATSLQALIAKLGLCGLVHEDKLV